MMVALISRLRFVCLLTGCLIGLCTAQHAMGQLASRALALQPGGYVFADYPDVFDTAGGNGLTIEGWFYLNRRPEEREWWILFAKPGSYLLAIMGRNPDDDSQADYPKDAIFMIEHVVTTAGIIGASIERFGRHLREDERDEFPPLKEWFHISLDFISDGRVLKQQVFLDGRPAAGGETSGQGRQELRRSERPFLLGGGESGQEIIFNAWHPNEPPFAGAKLTTLDGRIDEVRISNVLRYKVRKLELERRFDRQINPPRRFEVDADTVALWRFDGWRGQIRYADASGNGYTMSAAGTLDVSIDSPDKFAATWGAIKLSD